MSEDETIDNTSTKSELSSEEILPQTEAVQSSSEESAHSAEKDSIRTKIDISPDKQTAFLSVFFPESGGEITAEMILKELNEAGVIYGIDEKALNDLESTTKDISKMLIAIGKKTINGEDGFIKPLIDVKESLIVRKDQEIAVIQPQTDGEDGKDVLGESSKAFAGKRALLTTQENIKPKPDNPETYISLVDGYLEIEKEKLIVRPFFELESSADGYEAWVTVKKPLSPEDFNSDTLIEFLGEKNVIFGIIEEQLKNIFSEEKFEEKILIAKGEKVKDGIDGHLKFIIDTQVGPHEDEKGNVDYKNINLIQNVKKGDKLAEIIPPTEGTKGITVTNQEISPKPGSPAKESVLTNAEIDPQDSKCIIASINGHIIVKANTITVDPVFYIKEDVDYSTGNVNYSGSIFIGGSVKSGFSIKTDNDVEIDGIVEDAVITAGGNVMLKSGFTGHGNGKIEAKGKIFAQFCENQTIISNVDVDFCEYLMRCKLHTLGELKVCEGKGLIVGGEIFAQKGIEALTIGNPSYTSTTIVVGVNKEAQDKIDRNNEKLTNLQKKLPTITTSLDKLKLLKLEVKEFPKDKQILYEKLQQVEKQIIEQIELIENEIQGMTEELSKFKDCTIVVHEKIYPNTKITIFDKHMEVFEETENVIFSHSIEGIQVKDGD